MPLPGWFRTLTLACVLAASPARAWQPPIADELAAEVRASLEEADRLHAAREKPGKLDRELELLRALAKAHPKALDVQWRLARALFWAAEGEAGKDRKRALALEGRAAGEAAVAAAPRSGEASYYLGLCIGEYSHSVGILTALSEGLEARFRDPLLLATTINPRLDPSGAWNALGRYKFELPWPKRDLDRSVEWLRKSLETYAGDLRGHVYLAETLAKRDGKGDVEEAKKLLAAVDAAKAGAYDTAEELRAQEMARALRARLGW